MNTTSMCHRGAVLVAAIVFLCACGKMTDGHVRPSATGSIYECLVVIPNRALTANQLSLVGQASLTNPASPYDDTIATCYDLVRAVLGADMPCMPQMESYFKLTHVTPSAFDDLLKPTRNILVVDIDSVRYSSLKVKVATDYWSHPQAVYTVQSPTTDAFVSYWLANGTKVRDYFVTRELERQTEFYRASTNKQARAALDAAIGCDMWVSEDYTLIMDTILQADNVTMTDDKVQLIWCCNNKGSMRRDLIVYSYPYTDANTFTLDYLCHQRDAVLSQVITADVQGTYMGTEYDVFPPQMRSVTVHDAYAAEVRGLWKMLGGEAMGGPFVSLTRLDETRSRIVTAEAFVFAPGQKKRNALRQAEAMLYTLTLPVDTIH